MPRTDSAILHNGGMMAASEVPVLPFDAFRDWMESTHTRGADLVSFFARPGKGFLLTAVFADPAEGTVEVAATRVKESWASLSPTITAAHWFEREIAEQYGIVPTGHPWLKPIRFQPPMEGALSSPASIAGASPSGVSSGGVSPVIGDAPFFRVEGDEIHEVAVGPIHAGVIEPGHFRFQCHGETVLHLEISLGYQHRGIERMLIGGPDIRSVFLAETIAGDTTVGHATAYCESLEALCGIEPPPRGQAIRALALELERLANHVGDLGALAGDVGFLPTSSWCGRIRGDILNLTATLCGSRFGRGLVRPGGVAFDIDDGMAAEMRERLTAISRDAAGACELLWRTPSVFARFEGTGCVDTETARRIGLTGPAARASAVEHDVRRDLPSGYWRFSQLPVSTWRTGDVFARAWVRWLEVQRSFAFVEELLGTLPGGDIAVALGRPARDALAVSLVEGWRGTICHCAVTDAAGSFSRYKIVDPSFRNWFGLALALRGTPISDFPLCNKSFNLSYCGHDL
ncbi:MAG TPA: NADH-quinone oxidoreductase subunit C [Spirochaetia bacterium]